MTRRGGKKKEVGGKVGGPGRRGCAAACPRSQHPSRCGTFLPRFSPHVGFLHPHPTRSMSSSLNRSISRLQFHDLFDAALKDYSQKTGIDIVTYPLTTRLLDCDSSDELLNVLQEQARAFSQYQNGDGAVQLRRRLKPTVDILLGLSSSGVFGKGFGLVRLIKSTCSLWMLTVTLQRYLPAKMTLTGVGLLLAVCRPSLQAVLRS